MKRKELFRMQDSGLGATRYLTVEGRSCLASAYDEENEFVVTECSTHYDYSLLPLGWVLSSFLP